VMLYKNLPDESLIPVFFSRLLLDAVASVKFLVDGGFKDFFAVLKAHWKFYQVYPQLKKERKLSKPGKVTMIYRKNLVYEYFLKGKRKFSDLKPRLFS